MSLYVNPRGELRRWDKYNVLPTVNSEVAVFKDIDGDRKAEVRKKVFTGFRKYNVQAFPVYFSTFFPASSHALNPPSRW